MILLIAISQSCQTQREAELIIHNGNIYTVDPRQPVTEMVAVSNGKIIYRGSAKDLAHFRGPQTRVINLDGKTMTPGFIDSHAHLMGFGQSKMRLQLHGISSYDELIEAVRKAVDKARPGEWILGRGWHQSKWDPAPEPQVQGFPVHEALSAVSPDNPVYLQHASGHASLVNARAMEIAGVTAHTQYQGNGEIVHDANNNPSGVFIELASDLISRHIPENDPEMLRRVLQVAIDSCLAAGITGFYDAGADPEELSLYREFLVEEKLKLRLFVMLNGRKNDQLQEWFNQGPLNSDYLTVRGIKLYADGALGSRGAWLLEAYKDRQGHTGHAAMPMDSIAMIADSALQHGFQLCVHAIGDRANREVLNRFQAALEANPAAARDHRFRIEHAQHLSAEDIPRFKELGVIASMQAIHMSSDRPWAIDRLGKARIEEGAYVWKKLLKSGALIVNGTDAPVEPISPLECFYAAVTRKTLQGEPEDGYEPDQAMSREEALRSYTLNGAFAAFAEKRLGSIEVGKQADFVILSRDIMSIPAGQILETQVDYTIVNGEIVFQREKQ